MPLNTSVFPYSQFSYNSIVQWLRFCRANAYQMMKGKGRPGVVNASIFIIAICHEGEGEEGTVPAFLSRFALGLALLLMEQLVVGVVS